MDALFHSRVNSSNYAMVTSSLPSPLKAQPHFQLRKLRPLFFSIDTEFFTPPPQEQWKMTDEYNSMTLK